MQVQIKLMYRGLRQLFLACEGGGDLPGNVLQYWRSRGQRHVARFGSLELVVEKFARLMQVYARISQDAIARQRRKQECQRQSVA